MYTTIWGLIFGLLINTAALNYQAAKTTVMPSTETLDQVETASSPIVEDDIAVNDSLSPEQLAKCLTSKGALMYGAYWCPHCADQKKLFGDSVHFIKYIECDAKGTNANPQACQKANIQSYPTWTIPGGSNLNGTQNLTDLAAWSKCK